MKVKVLLSAILVCALVIFSGCATAAPASEKPVASAPAESTAVEKPADEGFDITVEEIYEANDLMNLFADHNSISYVKKVFLDTDDKEDSVTKGQYILHDDNLWFDSEIDDMTGDRTIISGFENDDVPATVSTVVKFGEDTSKYLQMMPGDYYADVLAYYWMPYTDWENREVVSIDEADGANIDDFEIRTPGRFVKTKSWLSDNSSSYEVTFYLEEETDKVLYWDETLYDNGQLLSFVQTFVTYDEPYITESEAWGIISGGEDNCELTVVFAPGTDDEEIQTVRVAKDTYVMLGSSYEGETLYSDPELTKTIDMIELTGDSVTVYCVPNEA